MFVASVCYGQRDAGRAIGVAVLDVGGFELVLSQFLAGTDLATLFAVLALFPPRQVLYISKDYSPRSSRQSIPSGASKNS